MSTGKRGREEEKETEKEKEEGFILTINRRESERVSEREVILRSGGKKKQKWAGDGERERRRGGGCVLTCTQHTHMSIGNRKHTRILYARAMVG